MNLIKDFFLVTFLISILPLKAMCQNDKLSNVEYKIIAEGTDSPLENCQVVCFNKYFNMEQLPLAFQTKYNLTDKILFQKKMLVEIFHSDTERKGYDKIDLVNIEENDTEISIEYNLVNSDKSNDEKLLSPFLIIQIPKEKKNIVYIIDGVKYGTTNNVYIKN
jgi:hypothetical protein